MIRRMMMTKELAGGPAGLAAEARKSGLIRSVNRFRREEDGSLLIFGLFCFVIMLYLAGVSLDLMRYEERRVMRMNTSDRATLAAADLNQDLPPKEVVKDYFRKAGLQPPLDSEITVTSGQFNEWRTVQVNTTEAMPTWFMNLMGINTLSVPAMSEAEERIGQVEISLVLDVSGSMNSNNRLINLKPAAKEFIDSMFDTVEPGKISMSIVTYSTQVSVGPELLNYLYVSGEHTSSDCIEFDAADFQTTAIKMKPTMILPSMLPDYQRNGHFEPFTTSNPPQQSNLNCPTDAGRDILAVSGDRVKLKAHIDNLVAAGNTSIDLGVKWGATLVDPSLAPVVDDLIATNKRPADFADRPYGYGNREAMKVIVVMTDGSNTTEYMLKDNYKQGVSIIWGNTSPTYTGSSLAQYSLWDATRGQYYIMAKGIWRAQPWGDGATTSCSRTPCTTTQDPGDAVQLTWPEVWQRMSINWLADKIISPAWGSTARSNWRSGGNQVVERVNPPVGTTIPPAGFDKDIRLSDICTTAKTNGVTIFTIGFEAPVAGERALKACASTVSTYYAATGPSISGVFASIASSINKLRLTN